MSITTKKTKCVRVCNNSLKFRTHLHLPKKTQGRLKRNLEHFLCASINGNFSGAVGVAVSFYVTHKWLRLQHAERRTLGTKVFL